MDESEIQLGKLYRDKTSGFEGVAVGRHEYLYGCTRISLQRLDGSGELKEYTFDAPALVDPSSGAEVSSEATGGPRPSPGRPAPPSR